MLAVHSGHIEAAEILAEYKEEMFGWPDLVYGAFFGDAKMVKANIGDAGKRYIYDCTALMYAAREGHTKVVRLLAKREKRMQDISGNTALMKAVQHNHIGAVRLLLDEKDIRSKDGKVLVMVT